MRSKAKEILIFTTLLVVGIYFTVSGLVLAQTFLAPLAVASLLAMILIPLSDHLEKWGIKRGWSSLISVLITLLFFLSLFFVVSMQVKQVADDWPEIEKRMKPKIREFQQWIYNKTGINPAEQEKMVKEKIPGNSENKSEPPDPGSPETPETNANPKTSQQSSSGDGKGLIQSTGSFILGFFSFIGTSLLTLIYIFFMLLYRHKLRLSILRFFPERKREEATEVLLSSVRVSQNYLTGRLFLIFILAVLYSVGLAISGVQQAILISIIAAFLSLIPYVGNVIGFGLALAMTGFSGGDTGAFIGVSLTFAVAQFVESYILEPYIVGQKVDLNPLTTIIVVVLGGSVWGIAGMIISIPVFGILKIAFDHIRALQPLGYALGEEDIAAHNEDNFMEKAAKKIKKKLD